MISLRFLTGRKLASLAKQMLACRVSLNILAIKSASIPIEELKNWYMST